MRSRFRLLLVVVAMLSVATTVGCRGKSAEAERSTETDKPSYELRGKYKVGDVIRDDMLVSMSAGRMVVTSNEGSVEGKASLAVHGVTETSILAVDREGEPKKMKVSYLVDRQILQLDPPGEQAEQSDESGVLQGESVVFEFVGGQWKKTLFGKSPTPEQAEVMKDLESPFEEDLIPKGRVKIGESWTARDSALRKYVGSNFHNLRGSFSEQFEKVVEQDGDNCALISGELDLKGVVLDSENREVNVSMSAHFTTYRSLKSFCDSSTAEGIMKLEVEGISSGSRVRVTVNGPLEVTQTQSRL